MEYLPSKNFVKAVGSVITILVIGWLVLYIWDNGKNSAGKTLGFDKEKPSVEEAENEANKDTDNDGLKDWEEALWKTNLNQIDSDTDGTSDGDEVKNGRNPKIAGACTKKSDSQVECSDKLQSPEEITKNKNSEEPTTFTAKIAQEFGKNYFAGKGLMGGEALSVSAQATLADSIVLGVEQGFASYQDIFKKEDLKISDSVKPEDYLNKIGAIFQKNFENITNSGLDIMQSVVSKQHFEDTKLFDPLITAYKNSVAALKNETVPAAYADFFLEELNILQNTLFAMRDMKDIESDPAKAIIGMKLYEREIGRSQEFFKKLKEQVEKDKINFTEKDGGYFFKQYFENI